MIGAFAPAGRFAASRFAARVAARRLAARRVAARVVASLVCVALLSGCGSGASKPSASDTEGSPHIVTVDESQRLAVMRFNNFNAGTRAVTFDATEDGANFSFTGWYDYESHTGYGGLTDENGDGTLILWNPEVFGVYLDGGLTADGTPPATIPGLDSIETAWNGGPLDPAGSVLHALLATISALGSDRPENPLLLQQAGALWLGAETVDGVTQTRFAGPPSDEPTTVTDPAELAERSIATYWLDDVNLLLRAELRLGAGATATSIFFGDAAGVTVPSPFPVDAADSSGTDSGAELPPAGSAPTEGEPAA